MDNRASMACVCVGHGDTGAGNDSKLSTFSPDAGVFIFGLTLKHKAIHHRAPLRPGLGPAIRRRDTRIRGQGPRHQSRRTLNSAEGILNKLTGDSVQKRLRVVVVYTADSTDWCATLWNDWKFCISGWWTSNCSFSHYFPAANGFSVVANPGSGAATPGHLQPPPTPPSSKCFRWGQSK